MKTARLYLIGASLVGAALWWIMRQAQADKKPGESWGTYAGRKAAETAGDLASGAVVGAGKLVGIPETDKSQCQRDLDAGRFWEASFSCPAGDFLAGSWRGLTGSSAGGSYASTALSDAQANDARRVFAASDPRRSDMAAFGIYPNP